MERRSFFGLLLSPLILPFAVDTSPEFDFSQIEVMPNYCTGFVKVSKELLIDIPAGSWTQEKLKKHEFLNAVTVRP